MEIWRRAVDATHGFIHPEDLDDIGEEVEAFMPTAPLWLAVDEANDALGFMLLENGRMEALFVDPAAHGRGVGRALVGMGRRLHPRLGASVNVQNVPARAFYHAMGFEQVGRSETDGDGRPYPLLHLRLAA